MLFVAGLHIFFVLCRFHLVGLFFFSTDMREASKRLADSLFQSYETDWAGEEDLGAIVEVGAILCGKHCGVFFFFFCCISTKAAELSYCQGTQTYTPPYPPILMHN